MCIEKKKAFAQKQKKWKMEHFFGAEGEDPRVVRFSSRAANTQRKGEQRSQEGLARKKEEKEKN